MVSKIIVNNIEKYDVGCLEILMQLQAINFLKQTEAISNENCNCAKSKIKENLQFCIIKPKTLEFEQKKGKVIQNGSY